MLGILRYPRTLEAGLVLASLGIGLAGAVLINPAILAGAAAAGALATALRLWESRTKRPTDPTKYRRRVTDRIDDKDKITA